MKKGNDERNGIRYEECGQEPVEDDGLESALEEIGGSNFWMWMVFLMASSPGVFNIWHLTSYVFLGQDLNHWCAVPELEAANWTTAQIRNISTGSETKSSCSFTNYNYTALSMLPFEDALDVVKEEKNPSTSPCAGYHYIGVGTSIVSEWDLVCDRMYLRSTVQMVVALGKFLGALLFGFVADKWGRKRSFVISCVMYIVAGPLAALVPIYWVFALARLVLGMAGSGCYNCAFTLLTEVCSAKQRTLMGILYNMSYPVGLLLLPLIAYYVPQWQELGLALSVPGVLLIINCWYIPESPRWLLSQGRRDDAWAVVRAADKKLALTRTTALTHVSDFKEPVTVTEQSEEEEGSWLKRFLGSFNKFTSLVANWELGSRLLICHFMWCVTAMTYFALSLNSENFSTDKYIYTAVAGAVEAVSYVLPIPILHYVGRRPTSAFFYLMSGIALLSIMAIPRDESLVILVVANVGRLCIGAVYSVIVLYTTELFPTVNRNTAVGTSSTMSHVGSIAAPYIVDLLGAVAWYIPSTICAVAALIAGLLVLLLPETKGKDLCDTVEEVEQKALQGDKVSIANCCSLH